MRHCSSPAHSRRRSLRKLQCSHIDKTFPDLVDRLRKDNSTETRESAFVTAMRDYERNFYKQEIDLLLEKIDFMEGQGKNQDIEIDRLRKQVQQLNAEKQKLREITPNYEQVYEAEKARAVQQNFDLVANRLKTHYQILMDKVKSDYQMRLAGKENQCKAAASQLQVKTLQISLQEEKFRKQKQELLAQINTLQRYKAMFITKDEEATTLNEMQSYKQQNALLRSFIYKIQMAEQRIQKLQQSRIKERKQFAEFAQENQTQKRSLLEDLQNIKSAYQERLRAQQEELTTKISQKCQEIKQLQLQIEEQRVKNTLKSSQMKREAQNALSNSMIKQQQASRTKQVELEYSLKSSQVMWSRIEASISREKEERERKIEQLMYELEEYQKKEVQFIREIEKLRDERNSVVVQNNNLQQKINFLKDQLSISQKQYQEKEILFKSKIDELVFKEVQSRTLPNQEGQQNSREAQLNSKISRIQSQLLEERHQNKQLLSRLETLEVFHLGQQSLLKNNCQIMQQSNAQLQAQKQKIHAELLQVKNDNQRLQQVIFEKQSRIREREAELCQTKLYHQKQRELIQVECEALRQKYDNYKQQCQQLIQETNQKTQELEVSVLRLKYELQACNKQLQMMNNKLNKQIGSTEAQIISRDERIQQLTVELRELESRHTLMNIQKQREIQDMNMKEQLAQQQIDLMQATIQKLETQIKTLCETKDKQMTELRKNNLGKDRKKVSLFDSNDDVLTKQSVQKSEYLEKIQQYRTQILQINSSHQSEIDHLKQYIFQLLEDNDRIRENYVKSAQTWRQMYDGVVKYNKFVDRGQEVLQHSTLRKKQIQESLGSRNKPQGPNFMAVIHEQIQEASPQERLRREIEQIQSEYHVEQAVMYTVESEICTIPDFSERKPEADNSQEKQQESLLHSPINFDNNTQSRCSSLNFPFSNNTNSIYIAKNGQRKYEYQGQQNHRSNAAEQQPSMDELGAYLKKSLEFESGNSNVGYSYLRGQNHQ